jgi:hypothetical protein
MEHKKMALTKKLQVAKVIILKFCNSGSGDCSVERKRLASCTVALENCFGRYTLYFDNVYASQLQVTRAVG